MRGSFHAKHAMFLCTRSARGYLQALLVLATIAAIWVPSMASTSTRTKGISAVPIDGTELPLTVGPNPTGAGWLKYGGYQAQVTTGVRSTYHSADKKKETEVEVVVHHSDYAHVIHDFFGTLIAGSDQLNADAGRGLSDEDRASARFVEWETQDGQSCVIQIALVRDPRQKSGAYKGVIGWYHVEDKEITTILLGFKNLAGVPEKLIDTYLAKYPSSVIADDPRFANWQADDIKKWADLLREKGRDGEFLHAATIYFMQRYDRRAFGLMDGGPWNQQSPEACTAAADRAITEMEAWLHKKTSNME